MEPGGSKSNNLVDKIRNIDGKIIKEGKLRSAMRGVVQVGSYVESLDGSIRAKDSGLHHNKTMPPINEDASEIFGEPAAYVNVVEENMVNQDTTTKSTAFTYSFANILNRNSNPNKKIVKLQELRNPERVEGAAVAIPMEAVEEVSSRFSNTLYGYFIGKRLAFPLVENYVKNTWAKFGLKRTQLHEDFFMFQFNTKEGMESVMESGPWLVRGVPLILNIWNQNSDLKKDVIKSAPLWVKLHHVPIVAYSEIGLSLITTQLGKPIMLDSYTSNMCISSWGRNTYARALVEFSAEEELKDSIVIAIPLINGKGHTLAKIDVEYEWNPPRCNTCKVFDHVNDKCPKNPKVDFPSKAVNDGFTMVTKRKSKPNQKNKQVEGVRLSKPTLNLQYRRVDKAESSKNNDKMNNETINLTTNAPIQKKVNSNAIPTQNSFGALSDDEDKSDKVTTMLNEDSDCDDVDEEMVFDDRNGQMFTTKGASTQVNKVISENNLSIFAILESHVADSNLHKLCSLVFRHWDWSSNGAWCRKGTRIILGWNHNDVDVMILTQDEQAVHTRIWLKREKKEMFCSFIYAHNKYIQRRSLWNALGHHKNYVRNRPWCLLGDFNATLFLEESTAGSSRIDIAMREFKECVDDIEVVDVTNSGLQYTWNQKPRGNDGILKKLDRIMANMAFISEFVGVHAVFKPYRNSDHSPSILSVPMAVQGKPKPFKFYNIITKHERFREIVQGTWCNEVSGFFMFRIVKKLKSMKKPLRKLLFEKGNLHANVDRLRVELDQIQTLLDKDPFNYILREKEATCVVAFNQAILEEERFLKQKAKIHWLKEGDSNSAYFHKAVKSRVSRSRIDVVTNGDGVLFENENVPSAFVDHYEAFLGQAADNDGFNDANLFKNCLEEQEALFMVRSISDREVKEALFSMGDDKSPGLDGYTAAFFKEAWDIMGDEVTKAIHEFFTNGKLLKELNHTIIALIPKVKSPSRVNDYHPISCCNVLFKCISKIIANRIKQSLKILISPNHIRRLFRGGTPRYAFKVDIQKAYDTVDWVFLRKILKGFGFHDRMVSWIMECVTTTSYSISINGILHGYFRGKRGLRQGDPLSPYLFTLVMEVLTLMLQRRVMEADNFSYHRYCAKLDLINLCFADDLFLFAYGDVQSARIIKDSLDEFKHASGLTPSLPPLFLMSFLLKRVGYRLNTLEFRWFLRGFMVARCVKSWLRKCKAGFKIGRINPYLLLVNSRTARIRSFPTISHASLKNAAVKPSSPGDFSFPIENIAFLISMSLTIRVISIATIISNERDRLEWRLSDGTMKNLSVSQHKLKTQDRVYVWDVSNTLGSTCSLCEATPDSHEHLFFICPFSNDVWDHMKKLAGLDRVVHDVYAIIHYIGPKAKRRSSHIVIAKLVVVASAYFIWQERNWRLFKKTKRTVNQVIECIKSAVRLKLLSCSFKRSSEGVRYARMWDLPDTIFKSTPDSHEHLFFMCQFSNDVWDHIKKLAGLDRVVHDVYAIIHHIGPKAKRRSSHIVIAKLVVVASAYFIWQERNWRLFKKMKRIVNQVIECIKSVVRLKLLSCSFKRSSEGVRYARMWDLPDTIFKCFDLLVLVELFNPVEVNLGDASWGWRKLLQIRSTIRPFIWHKINNGKSTSVWFDRWTDVCPLKDVLLTGILDGVLRPFSVACVWDAIRSRADMVNWYNVVWFSHCIPRHAIHMWLVIQQKLKTQDRLRQWDVSPSIDLNLLKCPLCDLVPDSHDHLFFECSFSSQVWSKVRVLYGMDAIPPHLSDVVAFIVPLSKGKTVVSIISRIVVAATSYYIWLERNGRLFKKNTSTPGQIVDVIFSTVRLKLVTFKFKKMSTKSRLLLDQWKIPSYCIVHDGSTRQPYLDLYCSYRVADGLQDARLIICSHLGLCLV
ncbi:hypothetical protein Tco_0748060 [Tanacetum coccineum]|uniref:Reverse transcriptase domain-containing protein n=1 Tax=Tanacetum coccineum TaxID=301880 RepID=A0ABQ4YUI8_9ASTR